MTARRFSSNPLITPADVSACRKGYEVVGVFNPGAVKAGNKTVLLVRVAERPVPADEDKKVTAIYDSRLGQVVRKEFSIRDGGCDFSDERMWTTPEGKFLSSLSHIRTATSEDGVNFTISGQPFLQPECWYESYGIEDARITPAESGFYITYAAVSPEGVVTAAAYTEDFTDIRRLGIIFYPENKDVVLLPGKIGGKYYALHRPYTPLFEKQHIWIAESQDLSDWGNHRLVYTGQKDGWDCVRVGAGAPPIETDSGWLEIYHGVDENNTYRAGALLLDKDQPWKVLAKTEKPLFEPSQDYEKEGFYGNVVFPCGVIRDGEDLFVYYGASDSVVCGLKMEIRWVLSRLS